MWWNARSAVVVPKRDGLWLATWGKDEDHPDYITLARLKVFEPPARLVMGDVEYWVGDQQPLTFADDLETEFRVEPLRSGSRLTVFQTGFPDDSSGDEFYQGCCQGWKSTLAALKDFF